MRPLNKSSQIMLSVISGILLLVALAAFWFTGTIYDQNRFVELTLQVAEKQDVRDAVAGALVEDVFQDFPILLGIAEDNIAPAISGILASADFKPILEDLAVAFHQSAISEEPYDLALNIVPLKRTLLALGSLFGEGSTLTGLGESIPDEILIVPASDIPSLKSTGVTMTWLGPLAGFIALCIMAMLIIGSKEKLVTVQRISAVFTGIGVLALLMIPYMRSISMAQLSDQYARVIQGAVFDVFTGDLNEALMMFTALSFLVFIVFYIIRRRQEALVDSKQSAPKKLPSKKKK